MTDPPSVLVIGGGITGLAAAVALVERSIRVTVWDGGDRLGGKIATSPFAGVGAVDEGPDAYLARMPAAVDFAARLGLTGDEITAPERLPAAIWHDGLHDIPDGVLLGVPAAVWPFVTTRLLSWRGKLRAGLEPFLPRTDPDDCLGALVRARFGDEVQDRLVDALVGSIYATDTDRYSLAAVPQLAALAERHRSLLLGGRTARAAMPPPDPSRPIFHAPRAGMAELVDRAAGTVRAAGGTILTGRSATSIEPDGSGWRVDGERFDGVVVATPAADAATLLGSVAPESVAPLTGIEAAGIVMVRLAVGDFPDRWRGRTGYLVPKPVQRTVTAVSFASQKWAHWRPSDDRQILRVSLGRDGLDVFDLDDAALLQATTDEMSRHLRWDVRPDEVSITRWPAAFPQYRPHHHERVAAIEAALPGGIAVAGASYHGVGVPACIAGGRRAADRVAGGYTG